ncbi:MAG: hypothetical protein JSR82_04325, partial [Verrucomicrobia bacterium]|nr:hypothetical protein [Verrucomicrobiota bacterium]
MQFSHKLRYLFKPLDPQAPTEMHEEVATFRRRMRWGSVLFVLLVAAGFAALPTLRAVKSWHARRLVAEAETFMAERNWNAASQRLGDAYTFAPGEPGVLLATARLAAESGNTGQAVELWSRVCDRPDATPEQRLELALALVRAGRPASEASAQLLLAGAAAQTARGRFVAAAIAYRLADLTGAIQLLREAVKLDPKDPAMKIQLASPLVFRAARDKDAAAEAALLLYEAQKDPRERLNAGRLLRQLRLQTGDIRRAREEAMTVLSLDGATLDDSLQLAEIVKRLGDRSAVDAVLNPLLAEAPKNRGMSAALANWLLDQAQVNAAARLLERTPPEWRRALPLALTYARHLDDARRVADLREHLRNVDWTGAEPEREAWNARLAQLQNNERLRTETWAGLEKRAVGQRTLLLRLLYIAKPWRWHTERLRLLHQLASMPPLDQAVLEEWRQVAQAAGQTVDLCEASWQLLEVGTNDPVVRSDAARCALLLNRRVEDARKLAAEVYEESPGQPDFAATHAAGLRSAGQLEEAKRILAPWVQMQARGGTLPDRIAFEYAATLAAAGDARG